LGDTYLAEEAGQTLAPETSLERFVEQFKYEPPTESEFTMGGTPIPATEPYRPISVTPPPAMVPPAARKIAPVGDVHPAAPQPPSSAIASLDPTPEAAERTRFLDLGEPASERPGSGTSTIVGPSFLGLSDAPDIGSDYVEPVPESSSHWRAWLALLVLAVLGLLGFLEWRAQTHQTTGPIAVMKMQIQRLKRGNPQDSNTNGATLPATDRNAPKPEMQVESPAKPPEATTGSAKVPDPASSNAPLAAPTASSTTSSTPVSNAAAPQSTNAPIGNQPSAGANTASTEAPQAPPKAGTEKTTPSTDSVTTVTSDSRNNEAKSKRPAASDDEEVVSRKVVAGQDEVSKADHASDSAAAAAWLWKATAKGNPEAPVRLADMYIKGDGVPKSCDQALVLLKSAAAKQNARARNRLGSMYATGTCVTRDRVQAYRWLSLALVTDPGSEWAEQNRDLLWRQMTADERTAAAKYQ
jgi:hypothetical protein